MISSAVRHQNCVIRMIVKHFVQFNLTLFLERTKILSLKFDEKIKRYIKLNLSFLIKLILIFSKKLSQSSNFSKFSNVKLMFLSKLTFAILIIITSYNFSNLFWWDEIFLWSSNNYCKMSRLFDRLRKKKKSIFSLKTSSFSSSSFFVLFASSFFFSIRSWFQ